jgi:hypothetical protein
LTLELLWHLLQPDDQNHSIGHAVGADGKKRPKRYGFGQQALSKRLRQLFHAGYVERHYPTNQPMGRGDGAPRAIYGLGARSAATLEERAGVPAHEIRRVVERNHVTSPFLRHSVEVARFRVTLELACRQRQDAVRLLFWEQGESLRDYVEFTDHWNQQQRLPVYPDAFFGLELPNGKRKHYFLEIDMGTEPIASRTPRSDIRSKLIAYCVYRKSKRFRRRYSYCRLPDGTIIGLNIRKGKERPLLGELDAIGGFQVLFVTPGMLGPGRAASGRIANILSELPKQGQFRIAESLFWFTVPSAYNIAHPESLFQSCWVVPKQKLGLQNLIG